LNPDEFRPFLEALIEAARARERRDWDGAIAVYDELQQGRPEDPHLLAARAHCHYRLAFDESRDVSANYGQCFALMERAIELAPDDARLKAELAWYRRWGISDYERAIELYREAIELEPDYADALTEAAELYGTPEEVIDLDEAREYRERAARVAPGDEYNWHELALLYREQGRTEDAQRALARALLARRPVDTSSVTGAWLS
jgi:tetratricopeptide (TPR) repeat protein